MTVGLGTRALAESKRVVTTVPENGRMVLGSEFQIRRAELGRVKGQGMSSRRPWFYGSDGTQRKTQGRTLKGTAAVATSGILEENPRSRAEREDTRSDEDPCGSTRRNSALCVFGLDLSDSVPIERVPKT